jgi:stage II sporulation protein M
MHGYIAAHLPYFLFVSVLFVMGVLFGALLVNAMTFEQKQYLGYQLQEFLLAPKPPSSAGGLFRAALGLHLKWLTLIFVLGISVVGMPFVLLLDFVKGVLLGFTVGFLVGELSWRGALFALLTVAPQNLLIVPALLILSVAAVSFALFVIRNRLLHQRGRMSSQLSRYGSIALLTVPATAAAALFEAFVAPALIGWVAPWLIEV